jgi:hypothetical protein
MMEINKQISALKQKHGEDYGEVVRCIIYHEEILKWVSMVMDVSGKCYLITFIALLYQLQVLCWNPRHFSRTHICSIDGIYSYNMHDMLIIAESDEQHWSCCSFSCVLSCNGHSNFFILLDREWSDLFGNLTKISSRSAFFPFWSLAMNSINGENETNEHELASFNITSNLYFFSQLNSLID